MLTTTIDWLSFTFPKEVNYENFIAQYASAGKNVPVPPQFGYTSGWRVGAGILFFTHEIRDDMGVHFILSGKTLGALQNEGHAINAVLRSVISNNARVTRLDLAKDATNESISLPEIWGDIDSRAGSGRTKKFSQVQGTDRGHTIYGGSRESERFLRIYDKAIEQGDTQGDYKRCELELKGDVARAVARLLVESDKWGEIFNGLLTSMVNLPCRSFQAFLGASNAIGIPKINKQTDRERWISSQVIPAIGAHLIEHPNSDAVFRLYDILRMAIGKSSD
jgi:phage replication initiation protein